MGSRDHCSVQPRNLLDVQEEAMKYLGIQEYLSGRIDPQKLEIAFKSQIELGARWEIQPMVHELWYHLSRLLGARLADELE